MKEEIEILKQISKYMEILTYSFIIFAILSLLFQGMAANNINLIKIGRNEDNVTNMKAVMYTLNNIDDNVMKIMVKQKYSE